MHTGHQWLEPRGAELPDACHVRDATAYEVGGAA